MIFVLPGMGADSSMFTGSWRQLPEAVFIDWPPYTGEQTLAEVATTVVERYQITDGSVLVGTSLGGMIACEIAKLRKLRQLILIGSAVHPDEINPLLTLFHPLARFAPVDWLQWSAASLPGELAHMFAHSQPDFIRASIPAIFKWKGLDLTLPTPLRVHGKNDAVIPPPPHVDLLVNGGHLIAMTHDQNCCDYILSHM